MTNPDHEEYARLLKLCAIAGIVDIDIAPGKLRQGSFKVHLWKERTLIFTAFAMSLVDALHQCSFWADGYISGKEAK